MKMESEVQRKVGNMPLLPDLVVVVQLNHEMSGYNPGSGKLNAT